MVQPTIRKLFPLYSPHLHSVHCLYDMVTNSIKIIIILSTIIAITTQLQCYSCGMGENQVDSAPEVNYLIVLITTRQLQ